MAKKRETVRNNATKREDRCELIAPTLPDAADTEALLQLAKELAATIDAAVLSGDVATEEAARQTYQAIIWKMNGGTMFASLDGPDAPGNVIAAHCAAPIGTVPGWWQDGEFLVTAAGVRARVVFGHGFTGGTRHFAFHAVDPNKPFISETGYRSHFQAPVTGATVEAVATGVLESLVADRGGRVTIDRASRDRIEVPAWVTAAPGDDAPAIYADAKGQLTLAF